MEQNGVVGPSSSRLGPHRPDEGFVNGERDLGVPVSLSSKDEVGVMEQNGFVGPSS
jgi:hypothetical protein